MELRVHRSGLGKRLSKQRMHAAVLAGTKIFFVQQRLRDVEHRIVGTPGGEIGIVIIEKIFGRAERAACLLEQLLRLDLHAAMASSRALRRNGLCPCSQSWRLTKTRLTLTECLSESAAMSLLVRSTSAA